ncbi:MAG: O-antigen ligase C-terminal domain-containing protein [Proteobacteria bacterium]|nr:O-antigen ligase C-terminal domain-containing protein [Pseudomonadota bacterium]
MKDSPKITSVEVTTFEHEVENVGSDYNTFNMVYERGSRATQRGSLLQIKTDQGITGEYPGIRGPTLEQVRIVANYLIGKDALGREMIYNDIKRALRHFDMTGLGVVDICLWDIAGKFYDTPLYKLLGGTRRPLPAYASTLHGDENGGLASPEQFADFAEQCYEMGYRAFKIHGWGLAGKNLQREIDNVLLMGKRMGGRMALMIVLTIGLHSLLEYPLWYAYFLLPTCFALGLGLPAGAEVRPAGPGPWPWLGALLIAGSAFAVWDYQRIVVIYAPSDDAIPLSRRIAVGQGSPLFGHLADYAAATSLPPDPTALAAARRTLR